MASPYCPFGLRLEAPPQPRVKTTGEKECDVTYRTVMSLAYWFAMVDVKGINIEQRIFCLRKTTVLTIGLPAGSMFKTKL